MSAGPRIDAQRHACREIRRLQRRFLFTAETGQEVGPGDTVEEGTEQKEPKF